jgi:hypothetical protein
MSASDTDGTITAWELDVDDDGTPDYSGAGDPPASQQHIYTTAGSYLAELTVWDNESATGTDTATITVTIPNVAPAAPTGVVVQHYGLVSMQDVATSFSTIYSEPQQNDYTATHASDNFYHIISEDNRVQGGSGKAGLDITYTIPISAGTGAPYILNIEAYTIDSDDSYTVSYAINGAGGQTTILTLPTADDTLSYQLSGVSAGDTVQIIIKDAAQNPRENIGIVYIDHLFIQSGGSGGSTDDNQITWDASTDDGAGADDVTSYNVYRSSFDGAPWTHVGVVTADGSASYSYIDAGKGTTDATRWWYMVRAEDSGDLESDNSNTAQEPDMVNDPPYTPDNPSPTDGATGVSINTDLSWTGGDPDPGDTVTYDIYFGTTNPPPKIVSNQSDTNYDPGSLSHTTTYYWKIISWDNHDALSTGATWIFTTEAEQQNNAPYTPDNPTPTDSATGVSITTDLSWTGGDPDPGDTVTYDIYFGTTNPPPKIVSNQSDTSYDPGTLAHTTTYYWKIVSWDNHGANAAGPTWSFTTTSGGGVLTVTGITPDTVSYPTEVDVTITGTGFQPGAAVSFEGGSGPTPTVSNVVVIDDSTITATVTVRAGGPPKTRYWDVRVTNPDSSTAVLADGFIVQP